MIVHPGLSPRERFAIDAQWRRHMAVLSDAGIVIEVSSGLEALSRAAAITAGRGLNLAPTFDTARTDFGHVSAFSIVGLRDGRIVCTSAAVLRECPAGLGNAMTDLSFFYDPHTLSSNPPAAWCEVDADGINDIAGRIALLGGTWADRDAAALMRDEGGFARHVGRLTAIQAFEAWKPDFISALFHARREASLAQTVYGFKRFFPGVRYSDTGYAVSANGQAPLTIAVMGRERLCRDVLKIGSTDGAEVAA